MNERNETSMVSPGGDTASVQTAASGEAAAETAGAPAMPGAPEASEALPLPVQELDVRLTREEILFCLQKGDARQASTGRLIVQSVILGMLAVYAGGAYVISQFQAIGTLIIALAALALGVVMWLVPEMRQRHLADQQAERKKTLHVRVYTDSLGFGDGDTFERVSFRQCHAQMFDEMLVLRFQGGYLVGLPRRLLTEEAWALLGSRLQPRDAASHAAKKR